MDLPDIGADVALSAPSVHERIKKLESAASSKVTARSSTPTSSVSGCSRSWPSSRTHALTGRRWRATSGPSRGSLTATTSPARRTSCSRSARVTRAPRTGAQRHPGDRPGRLDADDRRPLVRLLRSAAAGRGRHDARAVDEHGRRSPLGRVVLRLTQVEARSVEVAAVQVEDLRHDRLRHVAAPAADRLAIQPASMARASTAKSSSCRATRPTIAQITAEGPKRTTRKTQNANGSLTAE